MIHSARHRRLPSLFLAFYNIEGSMIDAGSVWLHPRGGAAALAKRMVGDSTWGSTSYNARGGYMS
jgi:hypothetical protein